MEESASQEVSLCLPYLLWFSRLAFWEWCHPIRQGQSLPGPLQVSVLGRTSGPLAFQRPNPQDTENGKPTEETDTARELSQWSTSAHGGELYVLAAGVNASKFHSAGNTPKQSGQVKSSSLMMQMFRQGAHQRKINSGS